MGPRENDRAESHENAGKLDRYIAIDEKLQSIVDGSANPLPWCDAWRHSTGDKEASPEERLAVWKSVRDSGILPENAGFYLVADQIKFITELYIDEQMKEIDRRIDCLFAEHGFEEWRSQTHRSSEDLLRFQERCPLDWDRLYFETLTKHDEQEIARLYRADRDAFDERMNRGHQYFYPPVPASPRKTPPLPPWLKQFYHELTRSACFAPLGDAPMAIQMGCKKMEGFTDVLIFLTPARILGGPQDGEVLPRPFVLGITELHRIFNKVYRSGWFPFEESGSIDSGFLRVDGTYRGRRLMLRVFAQPPVNVEPLLATVGFGPSRGHGD
jgi:hypothetical protein